MIDDPMLQDDSVATGVTDEGEVLDGEGDGEPVGLDEEGDLDLDDLDNEEEFEADEEM